MKTGFYTHSGEIAFYYRNQFKNNDEMCLYFPDKDSQKGAFDEQIDESKLKWIENQEEMHSKYYWIRGWLI